ncbi:D-glycero-alpha-D-manno-heptose 7-phosphate kinase [compost metagenome]
MHLKEQCGIWKQDLAGGNAGSLGSLMHEGWQLKKKLADGISNPQIDGWYEAAMHAGATGGKIAGAGGGGFLMLYAEKQYHAAIRQVLPLRELEFAFDVEGTSIILEA